MCALLVERPAPRDSILLKGLLFTAAPLALQTVFLAVLFWKGRVSLEAALLLGGLAATAAVNLFLGWVFARSASSRLAEKSLLHERDLEQHSADLTLTNQDLQSKSQEVEMFLYSVSHDLRSPLVNLQGFSRELEHSLTDLQLVLAPLELTPQVRIRLAAIDRDLWEALHYIVMAVARSRTIIDALLRLARAGRVDYRWRMVAVEEVVHRVIDAMRGTIEEKGARITVGELPPTWGDPTAVEQIFDNLLGNALRYLDPGRPGCIEIGAESSPGSEATYWIRDNGRGIPDVCRERLFVPFQRFHGDVAQGEGIGLALVRRAVERHGGHIRAESREGEGTTFFLTLQTAADRSTA